MLAVAKKNPMRIAALAVLCLLVAAAAGSIFVYEQTTVLERQVTLQFKVSDTRRDGIHVVHVSGLSGASAMSVKNVSERKTDSSITILVHIFLARSGTTGNFDYDVTVPAGVNEIRYGNDGVVIWRRDASDSQTQARS